MSTRPEILYHYCSMSSFDAIMRSKVIRLSAVDQSNDAAELTLIIRLLTDAIKQSDHSLHVQKCLIAMLDDIANKYLALNFSMSEAPDLLSQWRGYADDATGVCIGFQRETLEQLAHNEGGGVTLGEISYNIDDWSTDVDGILTKVHEAVSNNLVDVSIDLDRLRGHFPVSRNGVTGGWSEVYAELLKMFVRGICLKNPVFSEEREWRLFSVASVGAGFYRRLSSLDFHVARNRLIPYTPLKFEFRIDEVISSVWLGPKNPSRIAYVEAFMRSCGCLSVTVSRSTATYR